jgi:uncharacterized protein
VLRRALLILCASLGLASTQPLPPAPTAHVTDPQRFLSPGATEEITRTLQQLETAAPCQAIVWIGNLPANATKETFATEAFKAWGIGHQGVKDGVALFIFPRTRGLRIEVGYGLEGRLTDLECGRILREEVAPRLKAGDRDGAVKAGVEGIRAILMKTASAEAPASPAPAPAEEGMSNAMVGLLIVGGVILFLWLLVKWAKWASSRPSTYSSRGSSTSWWDSSSSSSSSSGSWFDSSSSSSSGGSSFDSFSGGGGDSGGGGASGDW